jgi:lysophospholipase L1-like esterase
VGLAEIGLRLDGQRPAYQANQMGQWQTTPNMAERRMRGSREPHDFLLSTNADGLRTAVPRAREPDTKRVALMGDSNVFGWGLNDGQTLAAQAETLLHKEGLQIEIINAGQPGYSTAQVSWLFERTVAQYQPDLTVVFLSMHDHNRVLVSDAEIWRGTNGAIAWLRVSLARHSAIYARLRRMRHAQAATAQLMPDDAEEGARVRRVSDEERGVLLGRMKTQAEAWGGTIALGLLPDVADLSQGGASAFPARLGQRWAEDFSASEPMINLRHCCPEGGESLVFAFDRGHMNAAGNAATATALATALRARLE